MTARLNFEERKFILKCYWKYDNTVEVYHQEDYLERLFLLYCDWSCINRDCCNGLSCQVLEKTLKTRSFVFSEMGHPPHYHRDARSFVDEILPNRWIGQSCFIEYPPRSPDITPLHFLWGYLKDSLHYETCNTC